MGWGICDVSLGLVLGLGLGLNPGDLILPEIR